jgi:hypothetical protein
MYSSPPPLPDEISTALCYYLNIIALPCSLNGIREKTGLHT